MMTTSSVSLKPAIFLAVFFMLAGLAACSPDGLDENNMAANVSVDFNWDVRPILSDKCFQCHGPDMEGLKAGLRLDIRENAINELPESPGKFAIVPGDAAASELVHRITTNNIDERMPPESTHKTLTNDEINILSQWINQGADYKQHWAFISPVRTVPPESAFNALARNEIDGFILAGLEQQGLSPASRAQKETLINRVSLTLTGLPPTLDGVDAFLADDSEDAYENLVDQLLASPGYGEHVAAYWMDLARWSDTDGFLDDHHDRFLWPWRDWVINTFNDNMPFDQFATWQLAGDLLPDPTDEQLLATTFVRLGKRTTENGAIEEEYLAETMAERTDNIVGTAFLGLTMGCARCHDHRYDPITQRDYYSIAAFFNNNDEPGVYAPGFSGIQGGPTLAWHDDDSRERILVAEEDIARRESTFNTAWTLAMQDAETTVAGILAGGNAGLTTYLSDAVSQELAAHYPMDSSQQAELTDLPTPRELRIPPQAINGLMAGPYAPPPPNQNETEAQRRQREFMELQGRVPRNYNGDELQLSPAMSITTPAAVIQEPTLRDGVKGQALFFNETNKGFLGKDIGWYERTEPFSLDFWFLAGHDYDEAPVLNHMSEQNSGKTGYQLSIKDGFLQFSMAHTPPANMIALNSNEKIPVGEWSHLTLTYSGDSNASGIQLYLNGEPLAMEVTHDSLTRSILPWGTGDVFDPFVGLAFGTRFRVKAPVDSGLDEIRVYDKTLNPLEVAYLHDPSLAVEFPAVLKQQQLLEIVAAADSRVQQEQRALISARTTLNDIVTRIPQVLVMGTSPGHKATYVLNRGIYSDLGEEVSPRGLDFVLPWDENLPENRLGLAQWLFSAENPLTARVFVNRVWQMHFGHGLVETSEDFGSQGAIPSHPELLDWLTLEFIESGWDIKLLHRKIVTSATYQQDSSLSEVLLEQDPDNQWYARGPRWRMTAEMIRDQALMVSGTLNKSIGGPSAMPYQPEDIWNPLNSFYRYPEAEGVTEDEHHRRTLYTVIKRNALHPALQIFDFKNRTESIARRRTSNTPLQALTLMNDPQFLEAYRLLAEQVMHTIQDDSGRINLLYRLVTRKSPDTEQFAILDKYYHQQLAIYSENEEAAEAMLETGVTEADSRLEGIELAALANVASVIMNTPDAYTVR